MLSRALDMWCRHTCRQNTYAYRNKQIFFETLKAALIMHWFMGGYKDRKLGSFLLYPFNRMWWWLGKSGVKAVSARGVDVCTEAHMWTWQCTCTHELTSVVSVSTWPPQEQPAKALSWMGRGSSPSPAWGAIDWEFMSAGESQWYEMWPLWGYTCFSRMSALMRTLIVLCGLSGVHCLL